MKLADKWYAIWRNSGGPKLEREVRVCPERRWRADFAWPERKIFFEIDGGEFVFGRHSRRLGADAEKLNWAQIIGWRMFKFPTSLVKEEYVRRIAGRLLQQRGGQPLPPKAEGVCPQDGGKGPHQRRGPRGHRNKIHQRNGPSRRGPSGEVAKLAGNSHLRTEGLPVWTGKEEE